MTHDKSLDLDFVVSLWMKHPLFRVAGEDVCREFAIKYPAAFAEKNEILKQAGDDPSGLIIILDGTCRLYHSTRDGRQATVKLLKSPNTAGTLEEIHNIASLINISVVERSIIARFPTSDYLNYLATCNAACLEQVKHIAAAFLVAARNERRTFETLSSRVANLLLSYAQYFGIEESGKIRIDFPLTQKVIAEGVGTVIRSVVRLMSQWQEQSIIEKNNDQVFLVDCEYLESLAELGKGGICYHMGMPLSHLGGEEHDEIASIEVIKGRGSMKGRKEYIERELLIGRAPPSMFLVADEHICSLHCRIFRGRTGGKYWIEDLDSVNGTLLNDKLIYRALLRSGDQIKLGNTLIEFKIDSNASA